MTNTPPGAPAPPEPLSDKYLRGLGYAAQVYIAEHQAWAAARVAALESDLQRMAKQAAMYRTVAALILAFGDGHDTPETADDLARFRVTLEKYCADADAMAGQFAALLAPENEATTLDREAP